MTYSSRHDLPWWSDPDYTMTGERIRHPYPADYEPDPIYCAVCGDVEVENKGNACDRCVDSDDDEMRAMARAIRGFDMTIAEPAPGSVVDPNQKAVR